MEKTRLGQNMVLAYAPYDSWRENACPFSELSLELEMGNMLGGKAQDRIGVACYVDDDLTPPLAAPIISALFALAPYDIPKKIILFTPNTVAHAARLIDIGAVKVTDFSGKAGWNNCVFPEGEISLKRESRRKQHQVPTIVYKGELTNRSASNVAKRKWTQLTIDYDDYLCARTGHVSLDLRMSLEDLVLLATYGMEDELPVDDGYVLPIHDFDVEFEHDDPRRFSDYVYYDGITIRMEGVLEIVKTYCDSNSIRPYIHRKGFEANMKEMEKLDELTGLKSAIEAYYSGANINYILSGIER